MRRAWMTYSLLFGSLFLLQVPGFAQDDPTAQQRAQAELEAKQSLEAQQRSQKALADFLKGSRARIGTSSNGMESLFFQFRSAIPKFRAATNEYRWVLSMQGKLDKHLKEIGSQADVMLKYLKNGKVNHPKPDTSEFKDYSPAELQWETLNAAERIGAYLDFAVIAERQEVTSKKTMDFLYTLDGELQRLKWLTAHVK